MEVETLDDDHTGAKQGDAFIRMIQPEEELYKRMGEKGGMSITENVQLFEALSSLGYKDSEIRSVIRHIPAESKELPEKIKEALKVLSKRS